MTTTTEPEDPERLADDFSLDELAARREQALEHIRKARALWPGLVRLPSREREGNLGKLVAQIGPPLRLLFEELTSDAGDGAEQREAKAALTAIFDASLGGQDHGKDSRRFEIELLTRRLARVAMEQEIVAELEDLRQHFADDVLHTGELVIGPGLQALELARVLAGTNPTYRSMLARMLDKLGEMTKRARQRQQEARKAKGKTG